MSSTMGRKALMAAIFWLALNNTSGKAVHSATGVSLIDNISEESVSRLYHKVPIGVYASATPYAAYSYHVPQFVAPNNNQVKEENLLAQSTNAFLKDSYGRTFVETPQSFAYKATFPQQFVPLQNLPAHLSQPLVAAAPNTQYGRSTPHFFGAIPIRFGNLQAFSTNPISQFNVPQPMVYADNVKTLTGTTALNRQINDLPVAQQQPSSNKNVYVNTLGYKQYNQLANEPTFQRTHEGPKLSFAASDQKEKKQNIVHKLPLINARKEASISSIVNGKKTVANLITKPPVPLLDLTLLEPLTFDNPLVPQVQHFLPRIHQVTYKTLPEINQAKQHEMVFMVQKTNSYDSEEKPENVSPKKKQKKRPSKKETEDEIELNEPPSVVTVDETLNETPEISYEINSPNYKESFSKKKVSYKKETESEPVNISYEKKTESEPVHYSYEKRTENKPVHYSYSHNTQTPAQLKQAYYDNNNASPKHLIYHFKPETNSKESDDSQQNPSSHSEPQEPSDKTSSENDTEDINSQQQHQTHDRARHELDEEVPASIHAQPDTPEHREKDSYEKSNDGPPKVQKAIPKPKAYKPQEEPEHIEVFYHNPKEKEEDQNLQKPVAHSPPVQHVKHQYEAIVPEYEEDITLLPTHKPHTPANEENHHDRNLNNGYRANQRQYSEKNNYNYPNSNEQEKSKHIAIKEESPQEIYTPNEKVVAAVVKKQEEREEDFEKAYKDAAYGFPAYNAPIRDIEKDIYDPESYGASRYIYGYDAEKSPLQLYQAEGDEYPAEMRSQYKDARDKTNEEYYLDYAINRPKSLTDRYNKKADYYKTYDKHRPEKYFAKEVEDKKKSEKLTVQPAYGYHVESQKPHLAEYRAAQKSENPHDNSAFATRPLHRYRSKTQFVEPQYQYGFEPLTIPQLLDSELAAMASNVSPENLGLRKNLFKEKFYIKKTITSNTDKVDS